MNEKPEVYARSYLGIKDEKARRVLNTAPTTVANITAEQIEKGISLEALEAINVPVYRYGTQITIHGIIPDFEQCYVLGYKSLTKNQNGSMGIKYVAIDGEKKEILKRVYWALSAFTDCLMYPALNASGMELRKRMENKEEALKLYNSIPLNLIIGHREALRDMYGSFWVILTFNACPIENLWKFISWWTKGNSTSEEHLLKAEEAKRKMELEEAEKRKSVFQKLQEEQEAKRQRNITLLQVVPSIPNFKAVPGKFSIMYKNGRIVCIRIIEYNAELLWAQSWKSFVEAKFKCKGNKWNALFDDVYAIYSQEVIQAAGFFKDGE